MIRRLEVDRLAHGSGLGRMLFFDAVTRTVAAGETVTMHDLIVDAANDNAKRFYERFGIVPLIGDPLCLFFSLGHAALQDPKG